MREILFRGKTTLDNEWVIGAGVYKSEGNTWIITDDVTKTENRGTGSDAINPETVGQYTGLTDKNGKKIFEGDIMPVWENGEKYHYKVIYNGDCFMLSMLDSEQGSYPLSVKNSISEIIGNIHDNTELLKGGE